MTNRQAIIRRFIPTVERIRMGRWLGVKASLQSMARETGIEPHRSTPGSHRHDHSVLRECWPHMAVVERRGSR